MIDVVGQADPSFHEAESVLAARRRARRLAALDLPILIEGEFGTGRRTLAASVAQERSERYGNPIVGLDGLGGIPSDFRARFQLSHPVQAEVVVHHLEALSRREQVELAHLSQTKRIRLVAVTKYQDPNDVPVPHETGVALELDAQAGATRVLLPALRDRDDDVTRWCEFFLARTAERFGRSAPELSPGATSAILRYRWPGNLIELEAVLSRALCLSMSQKLDASDLGLAEGETALQPLANAVEDFRRSYIDRALAHFSGNRTQTARALGVDVRTIFRYLEKK